MPSFVRYGLILAALGAAIMLIGWATGLDTGYTAMIWGILALIASVIITLRALKEHRLSVSGADGDYTFMQGFIEAIKINVVSWVVGTIWQFVFLSYINTDYMERNKQWMSNMLEKSGVDEAAMEKSLAEFDKTPLEQILSPSSLATALVILAIYCAILAAVVRREKAPAA